MIPCPDCSHETSTSANACPRCGYPFRQQAPPVLPQPAPQVITREVPRAPKSCAPVCLAIMVVCVLACVVALVMGISNHEFLSRVLNHVATPGTESVEVSSPVSRPRELSKGEYGAGRTKNSRYLLESVPHMVPADKWIVVPVVLERDAKLRLEFEERTGTTLHGCDIFLVSSEDAWVLKDGKLAWRHVGRGTFTKWLAANTLQGSAYGFFPKGTHYLVVDNPHAEVRVVKLSVEMYW